MTIGQLIEALKELPQDAVACADDTDCEQGIGEYELELPFRVRSLYRMPGRPLGLQFSEELRPDTDSTPTQVVVLA